MNKTFLLIPALLGVTVAAEAALILPGQQGQAPTVFTGDFSDSTFVTSTFTNLNALTFTATLTEAIYKGGTNSLCPQCLTFVYQVNNSSPAAGVPSGIIEGLTGFNFANAATNVGYDSFTTSTALFASGGVNPCTDGRSGGFGSVISFDYPNSSNGACTLSPGKSTPVLVIETDGLQYNPGNFSAIDGSTITVPAFGPTAATPEPSTMLLFGSALMGIGFGYRRLRNSSRT
jgi:hypothetical protein